MSNRPLRIVQWTTGKVATQSVKAILDRQDLELVGLYAFSKEKVGRDVGDLINLGRKVGIRPQTTSTRCLRCDRTVSSTCRCIRMSMKWRACCEPASTSSPRPAS